MEQVTGSSRWTEIQTAERAIGSYREAMAAGLLALQAMIDDLDQGPREAAAAGPPTSKAPELAAAEPAAPVPAPKRPGSHFGFGDLSG
ncbi:MAG: hypothetical protein EOP82_06540 [Variovorax sp.]|nr:MAG: hypothetical protein EOP82_06540 [Variovorax sp.]